MEKVTKSKIHSGIRLDFYLPEYNIALEVHGTQHYQVQSFGSDSVSAKMAYNRQLFRDDKLRIVCAQYQIGVIEIPFDMGYIDIIKTISEAIE